MIRELMEKRLCEINDEKIMEEQYNKYPSLKKMFKIMRILHDDAFVVFFEYMVRAYNEGKASHG